MKNLDTKEVSYAGMGSSIQWGAVVGIAIDTYLNKENPNEEPYLKEELRAQLSKPGLNLPDLNNLDQNMIKALDEQLKGSGTSIRATDLKTLI